MNRPLKNSMQAMASWKQAEPTILTPIVLPVSLMMPHVYTSLIYHYFGLITQVSGSKHLLCATCDDKLRGVVDLSLRRAVQVELSSERRFD